MLSFFISGKNSGLSLSKHHLSGVLIYLISYYEIFFLLPIKMMLDEVKSRTAAGL